MNRHIRITGGAVLMAAALAAAPTLAQQQTGGMNWDTDKDRTVNEAEFRSGFKKNGVFGLWDVDNDGQLSKEEFYGAAFARMDRDRSGDLDEEEVGDLTPDMFVGGQDAPARRNSAPSTGKATGGNAGKSGSGG